MPSVYRVSVIAERKYDKNVISDFSLQNNDKTKRKVDRTTKCTTANKPGPRFTKCRKSKRERKRKHRRNLITWLLCSTKRCILRFVVDLRQILRLLLNTRIDTRSEIKWHNFKFFSGYFVINTILWNKYTFWANLMTIT